MTDCNHDEPAPPKETLREHMIRAHGCTEAMVRWLYFGRGLGFAVRVVAALRAKGTEPALEPVDVETFAATFYDPTEAEGFRLGYRFAKELAPRHAREES